MTGSEAGGGCEAGGGRGQLLQAALEHFAANGVHNESLRGLAAQIGTSHRMLHYHFGSREGLLSAVVDAVEQRQRRAYAELMDSVAAGMPRGAVRDFWNRVVDETLTYGPLVFELAAHAMQGEPHAKGLRDTLVTPWIDLLTASLERAGRDPAAAPVQARLALGVINGLLFDLLLTGDRAGADAAHGLFVDLLGVDDDPTLRPPVARAEGDGRDGRRDGLSGPSPSVRSTDNGLPSSE